MSREHGEDLEPIGQLRPDQVQDASAADYGLSATHLAQLLQKAGQQMLASGNLFETAEGVFSSCQESIPELSDRIIRAKDTGVPLVEVKMMPETVIYRAMQEIFEVDDKLVFAVLRADGVEHTGGHWGNVLHFERTSLLVPGLDGIPIERNPDPKIEAVLQTGHMTDYDDSGSSELWRRRNGPSTGSTFTYEHDLMRWPAKKQRIYDAIERVAGTFGVAVAQDGSIEGTAVEVIPDHSQLPESTDH